MGCTQHTSNVFAIVCQSEKSVFSSILINPTIIQSVWIFLRLFWCFTCKYWKIINSQSNQNDLHVFVTLRQAPNKKSTQKVTKTTVPHLGVHDVRV